MASSADAQPTHHLRGSVPKEDTPAAPFVLKISGYASCGFTRRANQVIAALSVLFPNRIKHEDNTFETRDEFRTWLFAHREAYGPKATEHGTAPFMLLNNQYLGGCDDTLRWARQLMGDGGNGATAAAASRAVSPPVHVDEWNPNHGYDFDLVIIGGGSGGLACSKEAAELGARVALLDFVKPSPHGTSWGLGGTCVNVGCIPKKLMHHAALLGEALSDYEAYGWNVTKTAPHDWTRMRDNVQNYIRSLNFGYRVQLRDKGVTYYNKLGRFLDPHTLEVTDKKGKVSQLTAARFVIAVGGRPQPIQCPGGEYAITSDDLFSLQSPPGKTCIVGAGYVALECAGFLTALGYEVTVLVRSILLRGFDRECVEKIGAHMQEHGTKLIVGFTPTEVVKMDDGRLHVKYSNGESDVFDTLMSARGRFAETRGMNCESAGLRVHPDVGKLVCQSEQTNVPHIYAIGDVIHGLPELTPVAIQAGRLLARRLFGGATEAMDYRNIATTIFTPLEYGCVGYSEDDAIAALGQDNIEVYHQIFTPLEWSLPPERSHSSAFAKVIVNKSDDKVIGLHYLGPNAGEITQGYAAAVKSGLTYKGLMDTVGIHPTVAEEITNLTVSKSSGAAATKAGC